MLTGEKLGTAIEQARKRKRVTKKAFADAMGVRPASVQTWVKHGRIAKERINDLVAYFSDVVGPDHWGLDFSDSAVSHTPAVDDAPINAPKGPMIKGPPKISELSIKDSLETNVSEPLMLTAGRAVAVVGEVQGSPDGQISIDDYPEGSGHGWIEIYTTDSSAYGLKVRGDGMRPRIKSGEHIVVEPGIEAQPGDDVVVKFADGSAVVKELLWIRDGEACLGSVSNATPPTTRLLNTILSIHRIAAIIPRGSGMYRAD